MGTSFDIEVQGQTILDAIQSSGIDFAAPCGGAGTCKKCQVLVKGREGLQYKLACRTKLERGMVVHVESQQAMTITVSSKDSLSFSGTGEEGYGLAVDMGTTTIVCRLHELSSGAIISSAARVNPQIVYGSDVIARITSCMEGHLDELAVLLRNALEEMTDYLCKEARIDRTQIKDMAVVGNTVIEHLAAGLSPVTIGVSPFKPLSFFGSYIPFLPLIDQAYFAPALSGYIGGDITAGLLASNIHESEELQIFLDLGTNGELALGSKKGILSCATAAGPVFEGANIHFGMPARNGAISRVCFDGETLEASVIGDGKAIGICGTGLIEAVAAMLATGVIDETGRILDFDELDEKLVPFVGYYNNAPVFYLTEDASLFITQADIRNLQLAKAAICAGILTLIDAGGFSFDDIGALLVAGGFGDYLDIEAAASIGLFPKEFLGRARSVGNTAIEGASMLLTSPEAREDVESIAATSTYIELSTSSRFNMLYMDQMGFYID